MKISDINFSISTLALPVVILIGPSGSGKTEVGNFLAADLGWTFLDTDVLIEQATGLTIPEIFAQHGEETLRFLENKLVQKISDVYDLVSKTQTATSSVLTASGTIISTGGGLPVATENFTALSKMGRLIGLYAAIDILTERVMRQGDRPLLNPPVENSTGCKAVATTEHSQKSRLQALVEKRKHIYAQADICIDTSELTIAAVVNCVKRKIMS